MIDLENWLRKGLGRPALFLNDNAGPPWRDQLLHGCTHRLVYDRQCEPSRSRCKQNLEGGRNVLAALDHVGEHLERDRLDFTRRLFRSLPVAITPGSSGTEARIRPSSSRSMSIRSGWISTMDSSIVTNRPREQRLRSRLRPGLGDRPRSGC
jgi:hypothetical protein